MRMNSVWTAISEHLESEMRRVHDEIRNYPAPIPACDAQFNYLLEQREALSSELARVREFMHDDTGSGNARNSVDTFLKTSTYLCDAKKSEIRSLVDNDKR
jgi:hypothetical protein